MSVHIQAVFTAVGLLLICLPRHRRLSNRLQIRRLDYLLIDLESNLTEACFNCWPPYNADVSILSVCNCIGRLACGVVGDWALMRHSIPRPVVFGWFIWMMALAMVLLAIGTTPGKTKQKHSCSWGMSKASIWCIVLGSR